MEYRVYGYDVGDEVTYKTFTGELRTVTVERRTDDIKDNRPGFSGSGSWGYDSDIVWFSHTVPATVEAK